MAPRLTAHDGHFLALASIHSRFACSSISVRTRRSRFARPKRCSILSRSTEPGSCDWYSCTRADDEASEHGERPCHTLRQ